MKPPIPTSNQASGQDPRKQRLAALLPAAAGLITIVAFAAYSFWQNANSTLPPTLQTGLMQHQDGGLDDTDGGRYDGEQPPSLSVARSVNELLLQRYGDMPLVGEPADLPSPGGTRLAGIQRRDGQIVESIAFWRLNRSAAAAAQWYQEKATAAGFTATPAAGKDPATNGPINAVYVRSKPAPGGGKGPPADQVLVVRLIPRGNQESDLTLWLRQSSPP